MKDLIFPPTITMRAINSIKIITNHQKPPMTPIDQVKDLF